MKAKKMYKDGGKAAGKKLYATGGKNPQEKPKGTPSPGEIKEMWQDNPRYKSLWAATMYNFAKTNGAAPDKHKNEQGYTNYMNDLTAKFDNVLTAMYKKDPNITSVATDSYIKGSGLGGLKPDPKSTANVIQKKYGVDKKYLSGDEKRGIDGSGTSSTIKMNWNDPYANVRNKK